MPKQSSHRYPLVPSVQSRTSRLSPLALIPAVPVRLGGPEGPQLYAAVDTGAKISAITETTLDELERTQISLSKRPVETIEGSVEVANMTLVLCDPTFNPWIDLGEVPFAVIGGQALLEPTSRILLGFDSCLAR